MCNEPSRLVIGATQNDDFAAHYPTQAAQDREPAVLTAALRHVIDARGGLAKVAEVGKLSRQSLYKAFPLTGQGNPTAKTMFAASRTSELQLSFKGAWVFLMGMPFSALLNE